MGIYCEVRGGVYCGVKETLLRRHCSRFRDVDYVVVPPRKMVVVTCHFSRLDNQWDRYHMAVFNFRSLNFSVLKESSIISKRHQNFLFGRLYQVGKQIVA